MGVLHVFQIVQMVPNRVKHHTFESWKVDPSLRLMYIKNLNLKDNGKDFAPLVS